MESTLILPDDVLGVIRAFSRPYRTRPDWRTCKRFESWKIKQFCAYHHYLLHTLVWFSVTDEYGYRVFFDRQDVMQFMHETNMVNRILRFQENVPIELHLHDLLYIWFEQNWAAGISALPV